MKIDNDFLDFKDIPQLVTYFKDEALKIDLKRSSPLVYKKLQIRKIKINSIDNTEQLHVFKNLCNDSFDLIKNKLAYVIADEVYCNRLNYKDAPFLIFIRLYLEYEEIFKVLKELSFNNSNTHPNEIDKIKEKPKPFTFEQFFNKNVSDEVIQKIKTDFKDYYGKKMAILIYLLESDFKLITYSLDSKISGRSAFVNALCESNRNMQPINIKFITHTYKLDINNVEESKDFINIKAKLFEIIK